MSEKKLQTAVEKKDAEIAEEKQKSKVPFCNYRFLDNSLKLLCFQPKDRPNLREGR